MHPPVPFTQEQADALVSLERTLLAHIDDLKRHRARLNYVIQHARCPAIDDLLEKLDVLQEKVRDHASEHRGLFHEAHGYTNYY